MKSADTLRIIAEGQAGYFTASQASEAGYPDSLHVYHTKEGHWEKAYRGIYRLRTIPKPDWPELIIWSLWSRDREGRPQGVIAGETALQIHQALPRAEGPVVLTVPRHFRKNCEIPPGLKLIKGDLEPHQVEKRHGYRLVTLRKALEQTASHPDAEMILTRARQLPAYYAGAPAPGAARLAGDYNAVINAGED